MTAPPKRRFAIGAEPSEAGTQFRVWAPERSRVSVVKRSPSGSQNEVPLAAEEGGYFSGFSSEFHSGDRYAFRLDDGSESFPDPASRYQPDGPHGPSQIVDAQAFTWKDRSFREQEDARVIYELHVGTFTQEGTCRAAAARFAELRDVGVTMIELMPVSDFPGRFGWGYDGVNLFAPTRLYGTPDDLRDLVATAHDLGLAVILDVVYNHFGPDGNYLTQYSNAYFTDEHPCEWGTAINFDGRQSNAVREFFCENARYWIEEFHFDGLRLDATQALYDRSEPHIIAEIALAARGAGRKLGKAVYLVAENEPQCAKLVRSPAQQGYGLDALWNDDFHHSAQVTLTGRHPAYYNDYRGTPQELLSAIKWGYLFQGQHYYWQKNRRGKSALDLKAENFVTYVQNHDQVANSVTSERISALTTPAELRAMTALMLLSPPTPMLFQGQEFGASAPFFYFADQEPKIAALADAGRREFLAQFPAARSPAAQEQMPHPAALETFERCKLNWAEREQHESVYQLHRDLLTLRRSEPALRQRRSDSIHGSVLAERALALRFLCAAGDRLLIVNFGGDLLLLPIAEPLLAPPDEHDWVLIFCSEELKYGGSGYATPWTDGKLELTARSAMLFAPRPCAAPANPQ